MPLSVALITRDEEDRLPACLESITFADEILVVDSFSQDNTEEIAKSFGCRVILQKWLGFSRQKQYAVDNCANDWVLILDADEQVPKETAKKIRETIDSPEQDFAAYGLLRKNFFRQRWIRHCDWWPDRVVRLVDRRQGHFNDRLVHEKWITNGAIKQLNLAIEHYNFRNYSDLIRKMEAYSTLCAQEMLNAGKRARSWTPLSHATWMFIRMYILKLGLLDGLDGFIISILNAGGSFFKYAKLREMKLGGKPKFGNRLR